MSINYFNTNPPISSPVPCVTTVSGYGTATHWTEAYIENHPIDDMSLEEIELQVALGTITLIEFAFRRNFTNKEIEYFIKSPVTKIRHFLIYMNIPDELLDKIVKEDPDEHIRIAAQTIQTMNKLKHIPAYAHTTYIPSNNKNSSAWETWYSNNTGNSNILTSDWGATLEEESDPSAGNSCLPKKYYVFDNMVGQFILTQLSTSFSSAVRAIGVST